MITVEHAEATGFETTRNEHGNGLKPRVTGEKLTREVIDAISAVEDGPRTLKLCMGMCARCGTCAEVCPVYCGEPSELRNPAARSDLVRSVFRKHKTISGRFLGSLAGAKEFNGDIQKFVDAFYECTGCRRYATFCPVGIDNSIIIRKGRAIAYNLGYTPERLQRVVQISLETGNTDGANQAAMKESVRFLEEEIKDDCGVDVRIPLDVVGAEIFFVPPSGNLLVNPEAVMGIAKVFHKMGVSWTLSSRAFDKSANPDPVTYHDPCNFRRSCGIVEEPRTIMKAACADFREMTPNRQYNWCCGGSGGFSAMDDILEFRMNVSGRKKLSQIDDTGAVFCAAPCSNCKRHLGQLMEYHKRNVEIGGVHDMVFRSIIM